MSPATPRFWIEGRVNTTHIPGARIDLIARNASVLPAVGGAFEDLARPDIEEADDRFFGSRADSENGFDTFAETPTPEWRDLYRSTPPLYREQDHVFRYFCDGSIKTYFLGTIIENDRSYPLELTQIGSHLTSRLWMWRRQIR